ncbi:MAG TPA: hypothetical protein V6C76_09480 [Drouetiella sp.]
MADSDSTTPESVEAENKETASIHSADNVGPSVASDHIASAASEASASNAASAGRVTQQHYVSGILDDVLEEPKAKAGGPTYKHPMILDLVLTLGLLVAVGGFTVGMMNMYITHQAEQSILQRNYRAAITVLRGSPFTTLFTAPNSEPSDLLNQALYLDAMERLDANGEDATALKDLERIQPGSRYFAISQDILKEHFKPSDRQLEGKAEHQATAEESVAPKKPIMPPEETDTTP